MNLIDKDALVAEIKAHISDTSVLQKAGLIKKRDANQKIILFKSVLSLIDTLEVKEVDLEKEIKEEYLKHRCYGGRDNMLVILNEPQFNKIAKHFFELGLKAKAMEE